MDKVTKSIFTCLKPKVASLGFNKKDLESFAADIAENLNVEENISEEELQKEVEHAVETSLPSLRLAQRAISRGIKEYKDAYPLSESTTDKQDANVKSESVKERTESTQKSNGNVEGKNGSEEEMPAWAKAIIESNTLLQKELTNLKREKVADTRREELQSLLKDTGAFGKTTLRNFNRMKFETDEDFDDYKEEVLKDLSLFNQERADAGLKVLGPSPITGKNVKDETIETLSDKQLEELAATL